MIGKRIFVSPPRLFRKAFPSLLWNMPDAGKVLYLTFDDGPIPELTPWILKALKTYNAKATFFCVGDNVAKYPYLFHQIIEEGHAVGNHTFNHIKGWDVSSNEYLQNIKKCDTLVKSKLFRPPYGKITRSQIKQLNYYYKIIMWDVMSYDFDERMPKEKCLSKTIQHTKNGSIIVFHDNLKVKDKLHYVLPQFLRFFTEKNFRFESLALI